MKNVVLLLATLLIVLPSCKQEALDPEVETENIKAVIKQETDSYLKQDLVSLVKTWNDVDDAVRISIGSSGYKEIIGWDKIYTYFKASSAADWKDYTNYRVERSNWHVKICEESALVFFDQKMMFDFKGEPMNTHSKELRMLEKVNGDWKITLLQWIDMSFFEKGEADVKTF